MPGFFSPPVASTDVLPVVLLGSRRAYAKSGSSIVGCCAHTLVTAFKKKQIGHGTTGKSHPTRAGNSGTQAEHHQRGSMQVDEVARG
ncbi:hypothetical protein NA78x_003226 [Anatilimnocola sp. NA78]|uniref:hypothetical protein n=1 Tax=Anatilimnocola sp. NA78 TaxID=3415683 RepID=UPI003CE57601